MANTTNLNLVKPAGTDHALVSVINGNMDIIDSKVGAVPSNASVQGQIDTLNNHIASFAKSAVISSSSKVTHTFTVPSGERHIIFAIAASSNNSFAVLISASGAGAVTYVELGKGANVSFSTSTNAFAVTLTGSNGLTIVDIIANGNPIVVS